MQSWEQLSVVQPRVVLMLTKVIEKNRLAHAYLFEGSSGTGKQQVALQLAKSFFCRKRTGAEPCQTCSDCRRIEHGNHPDVHVIEPDGQSIKKHQVEYLQKEFTYRGVESGKKVYLIDHADLMTASAANSMLKFLEEPTADTLAVLMTERRQKILPTIHSRSQQLSFAPLPRQLFVDKLEADGISSGNAALLAGLTTNYNEAITLLEGDWIAKARSVVIQLMEELYQRPNQVLFTLQEKWLPLCKERWQQEKGLDMMLLWLRDVMYMKVGKQDSLTYIDQQKQIEQQAFSSSHDRVSEKMSFVEEAKRQLQANANLQLLMEKLLLTIQEG